MNIKSHIRNIEYNGFTIFRGCIKNSDIKIYLSKIRSFYKKAKVIKSNQSKNQMKDKYLDHLQANDIVFWKLIKKSNHLDIISKFLNDEFYRNVPKSHYNFVLNYFNARSAVEKLPHILITIFHTLPKANCDANAYISKWSARKKWSNFHCSKITSIWFIT